MNDDCSLKQLKSINLNLDYQINKQSLNYNLSQAKTNPNNPKKLFLSPNIERHPSAANLLKENPSLIEMNKADGFLCVNIILAPPSNQSLITPSHYDIKVDTIEDKLYENSETFWMKNNISQLKKEVRDKISSENDNYKRNTMSIAELYLDSKITNAIRKGENYEVIENAFKEYLRDNKQ